MATTSLPGAGRRFAASEHVPQDSAGCSGQPKGDLVKLLNSNAIDFVAVDFETATCYHNSACAVGLAVVSNAEIIHRQSWFIRPPDNDYHELNIRIHGITPETTAEAPSFPSVWNEVTQIIGNNIVVAHSAESADISYIRKSSAHYEYYPPSFPYVCTRDLARRSWPGQLSYRLPDLCEQFDLPLDHHDPLSDAIAAAELALVICDHQRVTSLPAATKKLNYTIRDFLPVSAMRQRRRREQSEFSRKRESAQEKAVRTLAELGSLGEPESTLSLERKKVLFTGTLSLMTRKAAQELAAECGAIVLNNVTKNLDYLIVGSQNKEVVGEDGVSGKMKKAMELAQMGCSIELIDEIDFYHATGLSKKFT